MNRSSSVCCSGINSYSPHCRCAAFNAFRDLVARYATGDPMDRKVLGRIYACLQDVEEAGFASDERLQQTFEALTQELDDALGE